MSAMQVSSLVQVNSGSFGSACSGIWSNSNTTLTITLGAVSTGPVIVPGVTSVQIISNNEQLKDYYGTSTTSTSGPVVILGTVTSPPALLSAVGSNTGNNIGAGTGDTIVFTFDQATNAGNAPNPYYILPMSYYCYSTLQTAALVRNTADIGVTLTQY
jgi:hypothetical protein